jgi:hypothetical protein
MSVALSRKTDGRDQRGGGERGVERRSMVGCLNGVMATLTEPGHRTRAASGMTQVSPVTAESGSDAHRHCMRLVPDEASCRSSA